MRASVCVSVRLPVSVCGPGLDCSNQKSLWHESEKDVRINPSSPGDRDTKDPSYLYKSPLNVTQLLSRETCSFSSATKKTEHRKTGDDVIRTALF